MNRRPQAVDLLAIGLGGALGALMRWGAGQATPNADGFPWTTFAINVVGCLLLALLPRVVTTGRAALFLGPGLLGSFTTMSAASEEGRALLADGDLVIALAYLTATLLAAVLAVALATPRRRLER
ncbi:CrcB protein [Nocardioides daedukensis]|uniref:Fluoride-specific ion channel FluC n=1 Tax=Nocardioides daedukensis TaxID=634462 RepID=A0A7Y9S470_9ACTN|nr:CrcB protein [Nocardioides daedukensis]